MKRNIDLEDDDFTVFAMSAIRYAIGRRTYVPLVVTDYLAAMLEDVSDKLLWLLERDIREQERYGEEAYGDPKIDKPTWMAFYNKIKAEIERRKSG